MTGGCGSTGVAIRILIVDDIEAWHRIYAAVLRGLPDCQVVGYARDGEEAVRKSQELLPDVVLLDVGMGHKNQFEAAPQIAQVSPNSRILFLGLAAPAELNEIALAAGAHRYIWKRNVVLELGSALQVIAEGKPFLNQINS